MAYIHALDRTIHFEGSWPASVGDSCAETARAFVLGESRLAREDLVAFIGPHGGYVRHPSLAALPGWDAADFSSDQALPLILGFDHKMPALYWRTAPGKLVSPGVWAAARNLWLLLAFVTFLQALLFKVPWRYSDDERLKWYQRIIRTEGQFADYLNFLVTLKFLRDKGYKRSVKAILALVDLDVALNAVKGYYKPEPNSEWIVELYLRSFK